MLWFKKKVHFAGKDFKLSSAAYAFLEYEKYVPGSGERFMYFLTYQGVFSEDNVAAYLELLRSPDYLVKVSLWKSKGFPSADLDKDMNNIAFLLGRLGFLHPGSSNIEGLLSMVAALASLEGFVVDNAVPSDSALEQMQRHGEGVLVHWKDSFAAVWNAVGPDMQQYIRQNGIDIFEVGSRKIIGITGEQVAALAHGETIIGHEVPATIRIDVAGRPFVLAAGAVQALIDESPKLLPTVSALTHNIANLHDRDAIAVLDGWITSLASGDLEAKIGVAHELHRDAPHGTDYTDIVYSILDATRQVQTLESLLSNSRQLQVPALADLARALRDFLQQAKTFVLPLSERLERVHREAAVLAKLKPARWMK